MSAGVVAQKLGLTRNQVCGIIDRARIKGETIRGATHTHRIPRKKVLTPPGQPKIKPVAVKESKGKAGNVYPIRSLPNKPPSLPAVKLTRVKGVLFERMTGCKYAISDHFIHRGQHRFCNQKKKDNSSYCEEHHAVVYKKQEVGPRPRKSIYAYR